MGLFGRKRELPNAPDVQSEDLRMVMRLAAWHQEAKDLAASDPRIASGMEKVAEGIHEVQTSLAAYLPPALSNQRIMPRIEIHIPMPASAGLPASTSQPVPVAEPVQPVVTQAR